MISNLPKWSWAGGAMLAVSAGMINVIALLGFSHQAATHVTGLVSHLAIFLYESNIPSLLEYFTVIFFFFAGAVITGFIIRDPHFHTGRRYGYALGLESFFLFCSAYGFVHHMPWGVYLASLAAGLQNALVSNFSGAIVRTTHLTGVVTDLGVLVGHVMRGKEADLKRIRLFLMLIISFLSGGLIGACAYHHWNAYSMIVPAALVGFLSVCYQYVSKQPSE